MIDRDFDCTAKECGLNSPINISLQGINISSSVYEGEAICLLFS